MTMEKSAADEEGTAGAGESHYRRIFPKPKFPDRYLLIFI